MSINLITSDVWSRLNSAATTNARKSFVAVAYFGTGASRLLPLSKGSTLVVDMSQAAVASGQTNPNELLKLIKAGVSVYSVSNLHAKVFVFGNRAFVGSSNASTNSERNLVEAVISTSERRSVSAARKFVRQLAYQLVTPRWALEAAKQYRPPKFTARLGHRQESARAAVPVVYVVQLHRADLDSDVMKFNRQERARAKRQLKRPSVSVLDDFFIEGRCTLNRGDVVLQVTDEGNRKKMVSPYGNVLRASRYGRSRPAKTFVYVELPRLRRKNLKSLVRMLGQGAKEHLLKDGAIRDKAFVRSLLGLWHGNYRQT